MRGASWIEYRRAIKKPLKPPSIPAAMAKLAEFGEDQAEVVEQSIANGWQGLFALKNRPDESPVERVTRRYLAKRSQQAASERSALYVNTPPAEDGEANGG